MLSTAEVAFTAPRREFMLAQQLNLLSGAYDFVVIDTPPALNILTINAYVASTSLIIPMEAEVLSLVGISQIQDTIEAVRQSFNPNLKVRGILLNKFNARLTLSQEILELAEEVACQLDSHCLLYTSGFIPRRKKARSCLSRLVEFRNKSAAQNIKEFHCVFLRLSLFRLASKHVPGQTGEHAGFRKKAQLHGEVSLLSLIHILNLMQYSKSYNAACRLMTTLDSVLDKLINGTGITT